MPSPAAAQPSPLPALDVAGAGAEHVAARGRRRRGVVAAARPRAGGDQAHDDDRRHAAARARGGATAATAGGAPAGAPTAAACATAAASTTAPEDTVAPFTYAWTGVAQGSYAITARATDNGGKSTTSAPLTVTVGPPNAAPSVSITSPANGAVFNWRSTVTIAATATDGDGTVTKVEFFRNNGATKLGEDTTAPYSYAWMLAPQGNHNLFARATDNAGAVKTSATVAIRVKGLLG